MRSFHPFKQMSLKPSAHLPKRYNRRVSEQTRRLVGRRYKRRLECKKERIRRVFRRTQHAAKEWKSSAVRWAIITSAGGILCVLLLLLFSPLLHLREITVRRLNPRLDIEHVQQVLSPIFGRHLLFLPASEVKEMLSANMNDINTIEVEKEYPSKLIVTIGLHPLIARLEIVNPDAEAAPEAGTGTGVDFLTEEGVYVTTATQQQFGQMAKIIQEVTSKLTLLDVTNKQVLDFSSQLKSLQDILKNPKQRGILGEYYLEILLKNVLAPESFAMQYRLGTDEQGKDLIPDAVVFVKDKIIPVDSKFSLENYNRIVEEQNEAERGKLERLFVTDLKNRIVETSKYIQPSKGTMDFAFMFIPHEAIYYDLLINKIGALKEETESLIQRAASKYKVIIVSPTSFLAYLQTVLQGLKAMQIEEQALDIVKRVGDLTTHLKKFAEKQDKLGKTIATVVNQYTDTSREFKKIDKDIVRITKADEALGYEPLILEKPEVDES